MKQVEDMNKDRTDRADQRLIKFGDLLVDIPSLQNGFQNDAKRYRQEIWDYIQYRESLVKWPLANAKIRIAVSPNHTADGSAR